MTAHGVKCPRFLLRVALSRELHTNRWQERGVQVADNGIEFVYLVEVRAVMDFQSLIAFQAAPQFFLLAQPIPTQVPGAVTKRGTV